MAQAVADRAQVYALHAREINEWRTGNGFYTPTSVQAQPTEDTKKLGEADAMLGKLMLVATEIAEASQALYPQIDRENLGEELADIAIRILDILKTCELNVEHLYNTTNPQTASSDLMDVLISVSFAAEAVRDEDLLLFGEHLTDALKHTENLAEHWNFALTTLIAAKMERNRRRPHKHGRKTSL